jgi:hypothetical protein
MAENCCQLVGNLNVGFPGCVISVSTNCATESVIACGDENPLAGPSTGTINITAYADFSPWIGCPTKAGVNIPYIRKYDCDNDIVYFIPSGQGQSFVSGDAQGKVSVKYVLASCDSLNASSTSGPTSIYVMTTQINGYGLTYNGNPISISTTSEMEPFNIGGPFSGVDAYLQNFSFDAQPGQPPTVSYSFIYGGQL